MQVRPPLQDMIWGAAISAAQTESAASEGGKGPSIWDEFCEPPRGFFRRKPRIRNSHHLADSSDFYTHYRSDIALLRKMGFRHFRFSISWPRVMPDGVTVNPGGLDFYKRVADECLAQGITPWITLYHWDLPAALEKQGGWASRGIIRHFERFAELCVRSLPQVRNWIILNEPSVFLGAGYLFGIHAPGKKNFSGFFAATHHAMLSLGHAYRHIKDIDPSLHVGSSFSFTHIEPYNERPRQQEAARKADLLINRLFFDPVAGRGYPADGPLLLNRLKKHIQPGDEERLPVKLDFIGVQTYTREVFRHDPFNPFLRIRHVPARERSLDLTAMDWEIHPESLYHVLKKVHAYRLDVPIYVTENGVAFRDKPELGRVHDAARIRYYREHIGEVLRARSEGVPVKGYFAWSLLDNFEWAEGYEPRFGLVYVDYESKQRILKDSAYWFRSWLTQRD